MFHVYQYEPDDDVPVGDGLFNGQMLMCPDCGNRLVLRVELVNHVRVGRLAGSNNWEYSLAGIHLNSESCLCLECLKCGWME